jgi:serine/threonine-protein kinase
MWGPLALAITFATGTVAATPGPVGTASQPIAGTAISRPIRPGTLISGRYRIVSILGKGGMGEVCRADDLTLSQSVALHSPESLSGNADAVSRFGMSPGCPPGVASNVCRARLG